MLCIMGCIAEARLVYFFLKIPIILLLLPLYFLNGQANAMFELLSVTGDPTILCATMLVTSNKQRLLGLCFGAQSRTESAGDVTCCTTEPMMWQQQGGLQQQWNQDGVRNILSN